MKKHRLARAFVDFVVTSYPDVITVRCPDGTPLDMEVHPLEHDEVGWRMVEYTGGNPFIFVKLNLSSATPYSSDLDYEPEPVTARVVVKSERTERESSGLVAGDNEVVVFSERTVVSSLEEIIALVENTIMRIWDEALDYAKIENSTKKMKKTVKRQSVTKFQLASPFINYQIDEIPDNFIIGCPDGSSIDVALDIPMSTAETAWYKGESPNLKIVMVMSVSKYHKSSQFEPDDIRVGYHAECKNVRDRRGYDMGERMDGPNLLNPTNEEIIQTLEGLVAQIWDLSLGGSDYIASTKKMKKSLDSFDFEHLKNEIRWIWEDADMGATYTLEDIAEKLPQYDKSDIKRALDSLVSRWEDGSNNVAVQSGQYMMYKSKSQTKKMMKMERIKKYRYTGEEDDPFWDASQDRWKLGGDTHVKVYQVDPENDDENDPRTRYFGRKWFGWEKVKDEFNIDYYNQIWEGDLSANHSLDNVYDMLQEHRPIETSQAIFSLSVGDLVEMDGQLYMVDRYGFTPISKSTKKSKLKKKVDWDFNAKGRNIIIDGKHYEVRSSHSTGAMDNDEGEYGLSQTLHLMDDAGDTYNVEIVIPDSKENVLDTDDWSSLILRRWGLPYKVSPQDYSAQSYYYQLFDLEPQINDDAKMDIEDIKAKCNVSPEFIESITQLDDDHVQIVFDDSDFYYEHIPDEALRRAGYYVEWYDSYILNVFKDDEYTASAKKSYIPDYHDFRTMLTNMKVTKNNRTVFKR